MKSNNRTVRNSRRSSRNGPIHFLQGLLLEGLGLCALIAVMFGIGRENWLLSLITSPLVENQSTARKAGQEFAKQHFQGPFPDIWPNSPQREPYLSHNTPWTNHH